MFTSLDQKDSESKVKTFDNGHAMPWESDCCKKVMSCVSRFICFVGLSISLGKSECERDNSLLLSSRITECGEVFKIYPSHLNFQVPMTSKLSVKSVASSFRYFLM
jgi:hypothetical protein